MFLHEATSEVDAGGGGLHFKNQRKQHFHHRGCVFPKIPNTIFPCCCCVEAFFVKANSQQWSFSYVVVLGWPVEDAANRQKRVSMELGKHHEKLILQDSADRIVDGAGRQRLTIIMLSGSNCPNLSPPRENTSFVQLRPTRRN